MGQQAMEGFDGRSLHGNGVYLGKWGQEKQLGGRFPDYF